MKAQEKNTARLATRLPEPRQKEGTEGLQVAQLCRQKSGLDANDSDALTLYF